MSPRKDRHIRSLERRIDRKVSLGWKRSCLDGKLEAAAGDNGDEEEIRETLTEAEPELDEEEEKKVSKGKGISVGTPKFVPAKSEIIESVRFSTAAEFFPKDNKEANTSLQEVKKD